MGSFIRNGINYSGGSGDNSRELTYEEYMALSEEEKKNGTTYYVPDAKSTNVSAILDTKAEIEANTEENKIAGALVVKELSEYIQKNMAYKDITDKFTADESKIKILGAYVENGVVFINVRVLAGVTGTVSAQLNDLTYAPRIIAAGVYMSMSSSVDKSKFVGGSLSKEGVLTLWFDSALSSGETVLFTYPLKSQS